MAPQWAYALVAAGLLTLAGTPILRRLALVTDFVDDPSAAHKSHKKPIPYLGGVGLIAGVLVGLFFTPSLTPEVTVIALGGALVGCLGLIDDHRNTSALFRFTIEVGVAVVALAAGLRIHATDIVPIDALITIVWIVGVTNAVNLLDNMDGAAAGVSAAAATAIFAMAILSEQPVTATIAAGVVGACAGFLAHNKRPASIFMGDTGSLFLGFTLAILTIDVSPALRPPTSFAVPLMLLALPVLDTATVTTSRLRRRRSVALGGKDHLSHRLVACGLSPGVAVAVLWAAEGAMGAAAVLAGREVIPLWAAGVVAAVVLGGLAGWTVRAEVYTEKVVGMPRKLKLAALGALAVVAFLCAPAVVAMARAYDPGVNGAAATRRALAALAAGDAEGATAQFDRAAADLRRASKILDSPINSLGLAVPGVRANIATTRVLVDVGHRVAEAGGDLSQFAVASNIALRPGADVGAEAARLAPAVAASASVLQQAAGELAGYDRPYLWPSLLDKVRDIRTDLESAATDAASAAELARLAPALLGQDGPRRYFLAVQDNTELRGTGGVIHLWGTLEAVDGRLHLDGLRSIDDLKGSPASSPPAGLPQPLLDRYSDFDVANTWENVNVSPDFSVTGGVIANLYARSAGRPIDGVVDVDLRGLAAILELTGPVNVDGWPEPVTAPNVVKVLVEDSPSRFPSAPERQALVGRTAEAAVQAFTTLDLGTPARAAAALGPAVRGGHLAFFFTRPDEEQLARHMAAAGEVPQPPGDSVMVVNQNLTATTVDAFLRRDVRYSVDIQPGRESAALAGRLEVTLQNDAPAAGLPASVIGPFDTRFQAGENRSYVSVYTPLQLTGTTLDGRSAQVGSDPELGRQAYSTIVSVPSRTSRTVGMDLQGKVTLANGDWYSVDILHQPLLAPERTEVTVSVPKGWRIIEAPGMKVEGRRRATAAITSESPTVVAVRLQRTAWARLWDFRGGGSG